MSTQILEKSDVFYLEGVEDVDHLYCSICDPDAQFGLCGVSLESMIHVEQVDEEKLCIMCDYEDEFGIHDQCVEVIYDEATT